MHHSFFYSVTVISLSRSTAAEPTMRSLFSSFYILLACLRLGTISAYALRPVPRSWTARPRRGRRRQGSVLRSTVGGKGATTETVTAEDPVVDWDWQQMAEDVFAEGGDQRPIVLFDGICNLCNGGVNFAIDNDESAKLRFCSLQSCVAQSLLLREGRSPKSTDISFMTKDTGYFSSMAVAQICMHLDAPYFRWFGKLGEYTPALIRESMFKIVSKNRYTFGENDSCRMDFDGIYTSRFVSDPTPATTCNTTSNDE